MKSFFNRTVDILCLQCGSECEVVYPTVFKRWIKKVKYCPYCGHLLAGEVKDTVITFEEDNSKE